MPTLSDVRFLIRELGSASAALRYAERIARVNGPLSAWYQQAADYLRPLAGMEAGR